MPNILGLETKFLNPNGKIRTSAVDWWRVINPLSYLRKKTDWKIEVKRGEIEGEKEWLKPANDFDIVYTSYHSTKIGFSYLKVLENRGLIKYVMDFDDDLFSVNPYNPIYDNVKEEEATFKTILEETSYITVTNSFLKRKFKKMVNGKIAILPNLINPEVYVPPEHKEDDVITIVYQGGSSHVGDLLYTPFHSALCYILGKYGEKVRFELVGFVPDTFFQQLPSSTFISGRDDFYEWVELWKERSPYWDIGVAPLEDIEFNYSKSPIKAMEYGLTSIPVIASPVLPYQRIIEHKKNGYFATTVKDWIDYLSDLIENKEKRLKMGETLKKDILDKWTIQKNYQAYINFFNQL